MAVVPSEVARRWVETWRLVDQDPPHDILISVEQRYAERHRHYHNLTHVLDCLGKSATCREIQANAAGVDLALWFHDIVYRPARGNNEARSSELAAQLLSAHLPAETLRELQFHILDTEHRAAPVSADGAVVVDIDLSILASDRETFGAYERNTRHEYWWVPGWLYRRKRAEFLRALLGRDSVFYTELFRQRFEEAARANIKRTLSRK